MALFYTGNLQVPVHQLPAYTIHIHAANGIIRQEEMAKSSFKYRAMISYNQVPAKVRTDSQATVKRKLKQWIKTNIPIDKG